MSDTKNENLRMMNKRMDNWLRDLFLDLERFYAVYCDSEEERICTALMQALVKEKIAKS
jgi:hypothetical protein